MRREELLRHVFDVERAIRWREDPEVLASTLERLFAGEGDFFSIKKKLVEKYGGDPRSLERDPPYPIASLQPGLRRITVIARVASLRRGPDDRYSYGVLEDPTGQVRFVAWGSWSSLRRGGIYRFSNVSVRSYRGAMEVVLGENSTVRPAPPWALGEEAPRPTRKMISSLKPGDVNVEVVGIVASARTRPAGEKIITEGVLADETGKVAFNAWDLELRKGMRVRVVGRVRKGPLLVFDGNGFVSRGTGEPPEIGIHELDGLIGAFVEVEGRVVRILERSGIAFRCPHCNRLLSSGVCPEHGRVEGRPVARLSAVLDDGRASILMVAEGKVVEEAMGLPLRELLEAHASGELHRLLYSRILGRRFGVSGVVRGGRAGPLIRVEGMSPSPVDPEKILRLLP